MNLALQTAKSASGPVYSCGPLIHNPQAVEMLKNNGVVTLDDFTDITSGTLIIRAHGMPVDDIRMLNAQGCKVVDATCPHVLTSQKQIKKYSELGYFICIVGDPEHPEILSLQSFATNGYFVISNKEDALNFKFPDKTMVIAQTTFNSEEFNQIARIIKSQVTGTIICDSICKATFDRQHEITELAKDADMVIVVGGKQSANTRRLAEIALAICPKTLHIETAEELTTTSFAGVERVVITAGASTPDFITQAVLNYLNKKP